MRYPLVRARRLRQNPNLRRLVSETHLSLDSLIMPYFVMPGAKGKEAIKSMPGQFRFTLSAFLKEIEELLKKGVSSVLLFGIPLKKDAVGSEAYSPRGIIQKALTAMKRRFPKLLVVTDVCLCEYTTHGHCGILGRRSGGYRVMNDPSVRILAKVAVSHADAGADVVAPSDMMDGRIHAIREALDRRGFEEIPILSYAAKYASSFYGPFREAAHSAPQFGDRKGYQMDYRNRREALKEIALDIEEGADIVMVKPALAYLDVVREARANFPVPLAAYNVSGEYVMVKTAAREGFMNERLLVMEILTAIRRAGADIILTYHAKDIADWGYEK